VSLPTWAAGSAAAPKYFLPARSQRSKNRRQ